VRGALALEGERKLLAVQAANGCFVAEFEIPPMFRKREFMNRADSLVRVMMRSAERIAVRRLVGYRIDAEYVYGRNMGGMKNLSGQKIALVGCGTIGSFLAHTLAQSGAGAGRGVLHLFDIDVLKPANLGRHVLGVPQLAKAKAEGMRSFLVEQLPHIDVRAHIANALDHKEMLLRCDLVIDATGEEALSLALNHHFVASRPKSPPILFVWLVGNGAAAEAIMCVEPGLACLKCLKPELAGNPRFRVLREEAIVERDLACGDSTYIPFPVSRSMQAAALAADMTLDWANGRPRPYFRTHTFDDRRAFHLKDQSPEASPRCPACQAG
jgi:molybdopterin/thiamine biosynthesis adenylyltransferase